MRRLPGRKAGRPAATAGERRDGHAGRAEAQQLALDVVDAEADVVQPVAVGLEPGRQRMSGVERLHQLQPGVAQIEVGQPDRDLGRLVHRRHPQAEAVAEVRQRGLGVLDGDRDVVETADHSVPPVSKARSLAAMTPSTALTCAVCRAFRRLPASTEPIVPSVAAR